MTVSVIKILIHIHVLEVKIHACCCSFGLRTYICSLLSVSASSGSCQALSTRLLHYSNKNRVGHYSLDIQLTQEKEPSTLDVDSDWLISRTEELESLPVSTVFFLKF